VSELAGAAIAVFAAPAAWRLLDCYTADLAGDECWLVYLRPRLSTPADFGAVATVAPLARLDNRSVAGQAG